MGPILSRIVTSRTAIVPRGERRGLFAFLSIIPEVENPYEYARITKKLITLVIAIAGAAAPMASAILFPALSGISKDFDARPTITNLSVALYMLGMGIFPLWWSSFAERVGYRTIYLVSFLMFVVSNVCCALSVNIVMFIVFRVCSGASAASAQTVGAGTISNIWEVKERGKAMGLFYLGPLCGPLLSPIIGGLLTQRFGWRSTMWFLAAFGAVVVVMMVFCLPETYQERQMPPNSRAAKSVADPEKTASEPAGLVDIEAHAGEPSHGLHKTISRVSMRTKTKANQWLLTVKILIIEPLSSLAFIRFPPVLLTVAWASITFGTLVNDPPSRSISLGYCSFLTRKKYILNVSIQSTFAKAPYNFNATIIGCLYIPNSLGYFISSSVGGKWNDIVMHRAAEKRRTDPAAPLEFRPEDRMGLNAWVAGITFPLALLAYGWLVQYGVFWFVPMIATFMFGIGSMLVFSVATTMLTEFIPGKSASSVAVNNCKFLSRPRVACRTGADLMQSLEIYFRVLAAWWH